METKDELRRVMRGKRRAVSAARRGAVSSVICRNILVRPDVQKAMADHGVFAVYLASEDEIDLGDLIAALKHKGVLVAAPRWNGELYTLARLDIEDLQEGPHHILEPHEDNPVAPETVAVWILPGLAFTQTGKRLGYGGGWYDRFLARASPTALTLGVAYPFQIVEDLPSEAHDRMICDIMTTETGKDTE